MPDVLVAGDTSGFVNSTAYSRYVVGIDRDIQYLIYTDSSFDLAYRKSIDGGLTWDASVSILVGTVLKFNVWYDRWTPGDTGTNIHIILLDTAGDTLSYFSLDTSDDTLSAEVVVQVTVIGGSGLYTSNLVAKAKARGGNLLVQFWGNAIGLHGCWRSVDGGVSWVARTDGADGNAVDFGMMFPGNEVDENDFWMLYLDASANQLSLKTYDDTGNSWSEALIVAGITESATIWQYAAAIRHSDNHLLVAILTQVDSATMSILTFDINGAGSITPMGNVVTNLAESGCVCLTINQQNDNVFVGYLKGGVFLSTVDAVYQVSTDGMVSWNGEEPMSEDAADDHQAISSTLSIDNSGGKFLPVWYNDDLLDLLCNVNNAVEIPARRIFVVS